MDALRPRRRLLYWRLWRSRCAVCGKNKANDENVAETRQQKALVRQLTRILTTSQLDTLARIVERRTCISLVYKFIANVYVKSVLSKRLA